MGHSSDMATDDRKARRYYGLSPAGLGLRRRRGFREDHREGRSMAGKGGDLDRAAVGADDALRERQAQSSSLLLRLRREERLEELLDDVRRHPRTCVVDDHGDRLAAVLDPDGHGPGRGGLKGVLRQ